MAKKIYYKIVEQRSDGIYTLFHGINGTKKLQRGKWITAEIKKDVMDGHGTKYTSGIHIVDGLEEAKDYAKKFRRTDRVIVPCYAKGLKHKTHSRHLVYLADQIKILDQTLPR